MSSQSHVSQSIEDCLKALAQKHLDVRFVKLHYQDAEMEPAGVPALLAYRAGDKFAGLVPVMDEMPDDADLSSLTLESVLRRCVARMSLQSRFKLTDDLIDTRYYDDRWNAPNRLRVCSQQFPRSCLPKSAIPSNTYLLGAACYASSVGDTKPCFKRPSKCVLPRRATSARRTQCYTTKTEAPLHGAFAEYLSFGDFGSHLSG